MAAVVPANAELEGASGGLAAASAAFPAEKRALTAKLMLERRDRLGTLPRHG